MPTIKYVWGGHGQPHKWEETREAVPGAGETLQFPQVWGKRQFQVVSVTEQAEPQPFYQVEVTEA